MKDNLKASVSKRLVASLIDFFAVNIILATLFMLLGVNFRIMTFDTLLIYFMIYETILILFLLLKDVVKGMSLGRYLLKIAVRDREDISKIPSISRLIIRNVTLILWPIELIILLINRKKGERVGDLLTKTDVINKN